MEGLGGIEEPHTEDIFEAEVGEDLLLGVVDTDLLEAAHVVFVGQDEDRQTVLLVEDDVVTVHEAEEGGEDLLTGRLLDDLQVLKSSLPLTVSLLTFFSPFHL